MKKQILQEYFFLNKEQYELSKKPITVVKKNNIIQQTIAISGSKSFTNRAIVLAGMSPDPLVLSGFLFAEDTYWGLKALEILGFKIDCQYESKKVFIYPPKNQEKNEYSTIKTLFLGKSGILARFFPAVILNWEKTFLTFSPITVKIDGEEQLQKRPLGELVTALCKLGASISKHELPTIVSSSSLLGECEISGKTSGQFLSGLLLAGCAAKSQIKLYRTENLVQPDYIKMTLKMIEDFGGSIHADKNLNQFSIFPIEKITKDYYSLEADASTACYFICLAYLHDFNLKIINLGKNTLQPDYNLVYLLQELGACIEIKDTDTYVLSRNLYKDLCTQVRHNKFINQSSFSVLSSNKDYKKVDCSLYSDQALTIAILALFSSAPMEVFGVGHIRYHESNRISGLINNLTNLGLESYEKPDGFIVYPIKNKLKEIEGTWETYNDHRFVMAGFLLASLCPNVKISNIKPVEKTSPEFFTQVKNLGFELCFGD